MNRDQQSRFGACFPPEGDEILRRRVPFPGWPAVVKAPATVAHLLSPQTGEQAIVERLHGRIDRLGLTARELNAGVGASSFELSFMEETQTRRQVRQKRGRLMGFPRKQLGHPCFIMVFQ